MAHIASIPVAQSHLAQSRLRQTPFGKSLCNKLRSMKAVQASHHWLINKGCTGVKQRDQHKLYFLHADSKKSSHICLSARSK